MLCKEDHSFRVQFVIFLSGETTHRRCLVGESTSFLRKGVVGDWRNYFSDEQLARFDAECAKRMAGCRLDFSYTYSTFTALNFACLLC